MRFELALELNRGERLKQECGEQTTCEEGLLPNRVAFH